MELKFDMIGLFVSDLDKMLNFYRDVLGFPIKWRGAGSYVEFEHKGVRFSMFERKALPALIGQEPCFSKGLNGTFELSINVGEKENVDRTFQKICEGGGNPVYKPRDEPWKLRSAMIADPDGNLIEIASDFWD